MRIIIPYTSSIYAGNYSGGRNQYLANLLLSFTRIKQVDRCSVFGAPKNFKDEFSDSDLSGGAISPEWEYLPQFRRFFGDRLYEWFLRFYIGVSKDDIVHAPFGPAFLNDFNGKVVVTVHEIYHDLYFPLYSFQERARRKRIYKKLFQTGAQIIAVSEYVKKEILKHYDIREEKVSVVHNSCHPVNFRDFSDSYVKDVKNKYNLPEQFVFYPAVKWPFKNHINLIKAISLLRERDFPDLNLIFTGSWGSIDNEAMRFLKEKINSTDWICDFDNISYIHLPVFYRLSSALFFPSLIEGFGLPIVEAMANSCPVACSDIEVFREVAGDAAVFFNPLETEDIAEKIKLILDNKSVRDTLIEKGEKRVLKFTIEKIADDLSAVYKSLDN